MIHLSVRIPYKPVSWSRARGNRRYTPEVVRNWKHLVADSIKQEIAVNDADGHFPYPGPVAVLITVVFPSYEALVACGQDADNIEKAIFDAFTGIVYPDDTLRHLRDHTFLTRWGDNSEDVGVWIDVYTEEDDEQSARLVDINRPFQTRRTQV
jgi:Holliday junction resolvase RusA-like endonuclease